MKTIALAIGKTDTGLLSPGHFGDSDLFCKVVLHSDGTLVEECAIRNSSKEMDEAHGAKGKMKAILEELGSIHCVVSGQMSPNFRRMALQAAIQPVVVTCSNDAQLAECLCREKDLLFNLVTRRQAGERSSEIPVLNRTDTPRPQSTPEGKHK